VKFSNDGKKMWETSNKEKINKSLMKRLESFKKSSIERVWSCEQGRVLDRDGDLASYCLQCT
jgi:hypothetical protein